MNTVRISDFLTDTQMEQCLALAHAHGVADCKQPICDQVIRPNIADINKKVGQENDPGYLAYVVQYALMQVAQ